MRLATALSPASEARRVARNAARATEAARLYLVEQAERARASTGYAVIREDEEGMVTVPPQADLAKVRLAAGSRAGFWRVPCVVVEKRGPELRVVETVRHDAPSQQHLPLRWLRPVPSELAPIPDSSDPGCASAPPDAQLPLFT